MGSLGPFGGLRVQQLVRDHNACHKHIKVELAKLHDDPDIVMYNKDAWRVAGVTEVSRCIGNAYLKREPFTLYPASEVPLTELEPSDFTRPLLSAEPEIYSRVLRDSNKFIIFGSGGLWKLLRNEDAAKIMNTGPQEGIAKRLVRVALEIAAREKNITYSELLKVPKGRSVSFERTRRSYHDISVMPDEITYISEPVPWINSFRSFSDIPFCSYSHHMYAPEALAICLTV
ncbi:unnamed protein product [Lathyrus sativus]|nr:unnamed protein product [Lathyrus sativus]